MRYITTNVRLDPDDYRDLQTEARAKGISLAEALRRVLREHAARWRGQPVAEAREDSPICGDPPRAAGWPVAPRLLVAHVRGRELVAPAPTGALDEGAVLVNVLGPLTGSEIAAIRSHQAALDAVARKLAEVQDAPAPLSPEDRDLYR